MQAVPPETLETKTKGESMKLVFAAMAGLFVYVHFRFLDEMVKGREMHQKSIRMNRKLHDVLIRSHTASARRDEDNLEEKSLVPMEQRRLLMEASINNRIHDELERSLYHSRKDGAKKEEKGDA